jgi:alpha-L-rhamnosidase
MTNLRRVAHCLALFGGLGCSRPPDSTTATDAPQQPVAELGNLKVTRLRWNGTERPVGDLRFDPRLEWQMGANQRGERQTAYQILVASDEAKLQVGKPDVWDSGKVASSESLNVPYTGRDLLSRQRGFWTVRVWDKADRPSAFAPSAPWEMSPWDEEVEGHWIGRAKLPSDTAQDIERSVTYLRQRFSVPPGFKEARLYATAFGLYEMSINGRRVGEDVLSPGYTAYHKRALTQPRDVTALLRVGENVIGGVLAGGWCTASLRGAAKLCGSDPPRLRVALEVTRSDGEIETLESDPQWKYSNGPLLSAELFGGESYDARRELPGWDTPGFDDGAWRAAVEYDHDIEHNVQPDPGVPVRVGEDVPALSLRELGSGGYVFDLGRRIVGWVRLGLQARGGTEVTLRYAQSLHADGSLELATKSVVDRYVARGSGEETWEPRFSLREFRYVELRGLEARPALTTLTGRVVRSETPPSGKLETSSSALNRLFATIGDAQTSAFVSVPSFGAVRAEGQGSLLDAQAFGLTACLNRDMQRFYRKWLDDIRDAQLPSAAYSELAPASTPRAGGAGAVAGVLAPWALYRCYADRSALDTHLTSMGLFLSFIRDKNPDLIWRNELGADLGDLGETGDATDHALLATAELVYAASALAQMMRAGGASLTTDALGYQMLSDHAREAFVREFVLPDGRLKSDTQTAYAVAIGRGVLDGSARDAAAPHLVAALERAGGKPTTGVLGSALLLPALSQIGRDDLAYALLLGFAEARVPPPAAAEWMYDAIGGIALDPTAPAGRHVLVRPRPGAGVTRAKASFASLYGRIETEWVLEGEKFRLKLQLPVGSSATVTLPFGASRPVTAGSGSHEFVAERP